MRPLNPSISPAHPGNHARADDAGSEHPREGPANLAANRTYRLSLARLREALVKTGLASFVSHFLGGGFGGKAYVWPHTLLAALAAKVVNRPVRLQLTRAQMYSMVGHQPASLQTICAGWRTTAASSPAFATRELHRIRGAGLPPFLGCQRGHFDQAQDRPGEPEHADRDARAPRGTGPLRARVRDGRAGLCDWR